jgi:hypothetical protein
MVACVDGTGLCVCVCLARWMCQHESRDVFIGTLVWHVELSFSRASQTFHNSKYDSPGVETKPVTYIYKCQEVSFERIVLCNYKTSFT